MGCRSHYCCYQVRVLPLSLREVFGDAEQFVVLAYTDSLQLQRQIPLHRHHQRHHPYHHLVHLHT
jgi:hypothetical protein